jgi:hypothetical protein
MDLMAFVPIMHNNSKKLHTKEQLHFWMVLKASCGKNRYLAGICTKSNSAHGAKQKVILLASAFA